MLNAVGAEDEMSEGLVGDDLLPGVTGLGQVDGSGRVFGRGVLVPREGEIEQDRRRRVVTRTAAAWGVIERVGADDSSDSLPACSRKEYALTSTISIRLRGRRRDRQ